MLSHTFFLFQFCGRYSNGDWVTDVSVYGFLAMVALAFEVRVDLFFNFWRISVLLRGPLILLFWTSGPGFRSLTCFLACLQWISQVHLWCGTCLQCGRSALLIQVRVDLSSPPSVPTYSPLSASPAYHHDSSVLSHSC